MPLSAEDGVEPSISGQPGQHSRKPERSGFLLIARGGTSLANTRGHHSHLSGTSLAGEVLRSPALLEGVRFGSPAITLFQMIVRTREFRYPWRSVVRLGEFLILEGGCRSLL